MDHRAAVGQLADDLAWLEDHCRRQPDLAADAGRLRLAAGLARNVVGPYLDGQPATPLHLAVVGGAGAGKSTVANLLAGAVVAEANPQAGYTRHPTAYLPPGSDAPWAGHLGFLGPLQRVSGERPANSDEDVYQVRKIPPRPGSVADPLNGFVLWDCPDMTTWAATGYVPRLIEVAALADVVVYVASDERYNDAVPTQFLHMLVKAGKAVVVVLTKMRPADADALADHFRQEVLGRLPKLPDGSTPAVPVVSVPHLSPAERADPAGAGAKYRAALLNQVLVLCDDAQAARRRTAKNAARFLNTAGDGLLDVARRDLHELDAWRAAVLHGRREFEDRYRREYLSAEPFHGFDRTRDRLMGLVELPGAGQVLSGTLWVLRAPYRFGRDYVSKLFVRPPAVGLPERAVLDAALSAWLDQLQTEARKRAQGHPVWKAITHGFDAGLPAQVRDRFQQSLRGFEVQETDDMDKAGRALTDAVEKNPPLLYGLRAGKAVTDVAVVGLIVAASWPPNWWLLLTVPLGVSATHQVEELAVRSAVEASRGKVRSRREGLVSDALSGPLADWLADWPSTGGTAFERLQQVLRRVPETTLRLQAAVEAREARPETEKPA